MYSGKIPDTLYCKILEYISLVLNGWWRWLRSCAWVLRNWVFFFFKGLGKSLYSVIRGQMGYSMIHVQPLPAFFLSFCYVHTVIAVIEKKNIWCTITFHEVHFSSYNLRPRPCRIFTRHVLNLLFISLLCEMLTVLILLMKILSYWWYINHVNRQLLFPFPGLWVKSSQKSIRFTCAQ